MFSCLLQKDLLKKGEVWRKIFQTKLLSRLLTEGQGMPSSFLFRLVAKAHKILCVQDWSNISVCCLCFVGLDKQASILDRWENSRARPRIKYPDFPVRFFGWKTTSYQPFNTNCTTLKKSSSVASKVQLEVISFVLRKVAYGRSAGQQIIKASFASERHSSRVLKLPTERSGFVFLHFYLLSEVIRG